MRKPGKRSRVEFSKSEEICICRKEKSKQDKADTQAKLAIRAPFPGGDTWIERVVARHNRRYSGESLLTCVRSAAPIQCRIERL